MTEPRPFFKMSRRDLVLVVSLFGVLGFLLLPSMHPRWMHESARRSACVSNLRQLGLVLNLYANENQDRFPPLDDRSGNLMFDGSVIYPEYLGDVNLLGCPSDPEFDPKRSFRLARISEPGWHAGLEAGEPHPDCVDATSYGYTGYALLTEADVKAWFFAVDALGGLAAWSNGALGEDGRPVNAWRDTNLNVATLGYTEPMPSDDELAEYGYDGPPDNTLYRLKYDVYETLFRSRPRRAGWQFVSSPVAPSFIPVLWDQISTDIAEFSHVPAGQNVLYMDGHVEYIRYTNQNVRFPTTPAFAALNMSTRPAEGGPDVPWGDCP